MTHRVKFFGKEYKLEVGGRRRGGIYLTDGPEGGMVTAGYLVDGNERIETASLYESTQEGVSRLERVLRKAFEELMK